MVRVSRFLGVCILVLVSFSAEAEEQSKEHEDIVASVSFVLGYNECSMAEYLDKTWLHAEKPLLTVDRQTGNWDFVQDTSPDAATQKAIDLWVRDATNYHSCYRQYMENVQKHFHLVNDYHDQYKALHNMNQSHIVEVSAKVHEFADGDNRVSQKFGWQYIFPCGRLYPDSVTEEAARKWASCSLRYEKKLTELIEAINLRGSIEQGEYLARLFESRTK